MWTHLGFEMQATQQTILGFTDSRVNGVSITFISKVYSSECKLVIYRTKNNHHKTLSLKLTYIKFDFDVSDCTMQVVTHTSKIKMMPYNSVQMINSTLIFNALLHRGTLMSKTLHRSWIWCMLLSVIEAYDQSIYLSVSLDSYSEALFSKWRPKATAGIETFP